MGFHVDLEELHKAANKLNQEASRIETQLTDAKNSVNKIITSEALQGKTGQAIYQQLNNVDAAVLVGLADTSKVLASEFSSLLSSFHSSIGETSNSAILDEDYLNQLKDNLNNFKSQHGAQEENISSIYASISDLISLSGPQSNYDADSDTTSQLLSTTIDKVTSFDSSGTAPTSADLLATIDTEVNQVSQTTDLPYTDSQYLSFISDVNFAKSIKSVDKQLTKQEKLAKEQAEQKARKEWAKQHPVVAWLQSQADLDANFFEGARKTLEKQNWDFFGGQLDKSVALTALGFVDGVCETIDQLALGAAQLGQLAFEGIEWGGNTLFKQKTPQWVKADVTGAWNNMMAASEFGTRLIALDADAWNTVAKTGEKVGNDFVTTIKTGDDYKIGGYLFDVATLVGPAAVGKLKYVDEASNLAKITETSEVASTVGKVEDGVKVSKFDKLFGKLKVNDFSKTVTTDSIKSTSKTLKIDEIYFDKAGNKVARFNNNEVAYFSAETVDGKPVLVRSLDFLNPDGSINWPKGDGFVLDAAGNSITRDANITAGQLVDRYGSSGGTFVSPIIGGKSFSFESRGLPYPEGYLEKHTYQFTMDINKANYEKAFNNLRPEKQDKILKLMNIYKFSAEDIYNPQIGEIAEVFGAGGGQQIKLGTSVSIYEELGFLKEIK